MNLSATVLCSAVNFLNHLLKSFVLEASLAFLFTENFLKKSNIKFIKKRFVCFEANFFDGLLRSFLSFAWILIVIAENQNTASTGGTPVARHSTKGTILKFVGRNLGQCTAFKKDTLRSNSLTHRCKL